jgi:hypothetical protein
MFGITLKRSVTTLAVMAGLLAAAAPAGASPTNLHANPSAAPFIVPDNGPDVYVVADNKDPDVLRGPRSAKWEISELDAGASGTGNERARAVGLKADSNEVAVEGFMDYTDDVAVFSGDAYVNEMGVTAAGGDVPAHRQPKVNGILMADMGGQF